MPKQKQQMIEVRIKGYIPAPNPFDRSSFEKSVKLQDQIDALLKENMTGVEISKKIVTKHVEAEAKAENAPHNEE